MKKSLHSISLLVGVIIGLWLGGEGLTTSQIIAIIALSCFGVIYGMTA